jgi:hypothetical protein
MKRYLSAVLGFISLSSCFAQTLPDTPSTSKNDSRVCYRGSNSLGELEVFPCEKIPPLTRDWNWKKVIIQPKHTSFWAGRRYTDPPIRTNSEILHSKHFRIFTLGIVASCTANLIRNWDGAHKYNQPHGGELLLDDLLPATVNVAMLFGSSKYIWAPIGVGTASYGIIVNTRSAINGVYF